MNFRRLKAVTGKELLHIVRDSRSLYLALALPLVMLLLFGFALTLDVDRILTDVYDQDQTPQSRAHSGGTPMIRKGERCLSRGGRSIFSASGIIPMLAKTRESATLR